MCIRDRTVSVSGDEVLSDTISLSEGWNLKGLQSHDPIDVEDVFSGKQWTVWKWAEDDNNWAVYIAYLEDGGAAYAEAKGFNLLKTISPGEGFWVNTQQNPENVIIQPPVIAGTVTYPTQETLQKLALYKLGLLAEIPEVEMPPMPGVPVKVYKADDKEMKKPLAETKTDEDGNYSFSKKDFDNPDTPEVEEPPQVPLMVKAEFKSPINKKKKVAVTALVDPTDKEKKTKVKVNPLTTAIAQKIKEFVEETFKVEITKEIMEAAKPFINMIAQQMEEKGLTYFEEDDLVVGEYVDEESYEEKEDFTPPEEQNVADKVIDKGTAGIFESMESTLIEKAEKEPSALGGNVQLDQQKKIEHFMKFLAGLGFLVQAGEEGDDAEKFIVFLSIPPEISDDELPGVKMFNDRAFRKVGPQDLANIDVSDPDFQFYLFDKLDNSPPLSYAALEAIMQAAASGKTTDLTKMAAVIKDKFEWKAEPVKVVNGIPIFGEGDFWVTPSTGSEVKPSELIAHVTGKLGDTPKEIAEDIASKPYNIMKMADNVINRKIKEIMEDDSIQIKQKAIDEFFKGIKSLKDLKNLVLQSETYKRVVEEMSHAIFAAFEPELYGKVLSASTPLKVKSGLVLFNLIVDRPYLIDKKAGWFNIHKEGDMTWINPNFENIKHLIPKDEKDPHIVSDILSALIGEKIDDGTSFEILVAQFKQGLFNIPEPEEFELGEDMIQAVAGVQKNENIDISGIVKGFDGEILKNLEVILKSFQADGTIYTVDTTNTDQSGEFSFDDLETGKPYELWFTGYDFVMPFFADGFTPEIDFGEIVLPPPPGMGGGPGVIPGVSLWVDQTFFNPVNPDDENNGKPEGIDFSNFNTPNPFIVFEGDQGSPDLFWTSDKGLLTSEGAKIASLGKDKNHQHGLNSGPVLNHQFTKEELEGDSLITMDGATFTLDWVDNIPKPEEDNAVYVIKDKDGNYFFIEVRFWDKDENGNPNGLIDMGFVKLGPSGKIEVPSESFIGGPPMGMPEVPTNFYSMMVGDFLDLDTGGWSAPEGEIFGYDENVATNADIRWMGQFYDTYWANEKDWEKRQALLSKSKRTLSVVNGAQMSKLVIQNGNVNIEPVAEGKIENILPGTLLLITTANQKAFIIGVKWVEIDHIDLVVFPKENFLDANNNLIVEIKDEDGDGIPNMLDDNDFVKEFENMQEWAEEEFKMEDKDGDGVPAEFDPNDNDPSVPFAGGIKFNE